ncbi:hypothetical protein HGRIS_003417 [Hohenbuehelia grisea]|uniref:cellulase n=1 Tax=Hohenbuehelia grisea TaxID=104357 RepID=A0ABR3JFB7_9AGAR
MFFKSSLFSLATLAALVSAAYVPSSTSSATAPEACPSATKFKFFGVNESGAEFGNQNIPGILGTDYTWPSPSSIDFFTDKGFNTFRIPFQLERLSPPATGLTGAFDSTYLGGLQTIVDFITGKGAFAVIEPHNFMIYNGAQITSTSDFGTWWQNLATIFKDNANVIFDVINEPHDMPASTVFDLNQAAVNGIRASGATSQLILVEGTSWTGAWTWTTSGNGDVFGNISDPNDNIAIEMHQYLDSDGSGTSETCVSPTIGAERLQAATDWLKAHNLKGFLGELGAGSNDVCISAVQGALCAMQQSDVWIGALWWAAGPWWGDYFQSIEPPSGPSLSQILPQALEPFL